MKYFYYPIFTLLIIFCTNGCTRQNNDAIVIRDCSGTYLRINNQDYAVCNPSELSTFSNDQHIRVKYHIDKNCVPFTECLVGCELYHHYESTIVVDHVY